MQIEEVEDNQIYRNKKLHLILKNGKHICYIDIRREAVVYTHLKNITGNDWELFLPEGKSPVDVVVEEPTPVSPVEPLGEPVASQPVETAPEPLIALEANVGPPTAPMELALDEDGDILDLAAQFVEKKPRGRPPGKKKY